MTSPVDREKLVKFLALTDSDQDGEAMSAARMASRLVRDSGLEWDDVIVLGPSKGWRSQFSIWARYVGELKRRIQLERAASHWQIIARLREQEIIRLREQAARQGQTAAAPKKEARKDEALPSTGHVLIDRLLASPDLDAQRRARVEAIATWFKRSHDLTLAEQADLETFSRQLEASQIQAG